MPPEQPVQTLIDAFMHTFSGRLDGFSVRFDKLEENQREVIKRMDAQDLNGSAAKLRQIAAAAPKLLKLADKADEISVIVTVQEDRSAFWRDLRRRVHWDQGVGAVVKWAAAAVITGLAWWIVATHLPQAGNSALPPSVPQVTAPSATHVRASP